MNPAGGHPGHHSAPFATGVLRPPSQAWEAFPLDPHGAAFAWAWFYPPDVRGLLLRIPDELYADSRWMALLTLRHLLHAAGIDPADVGRWVLHGIAYDAHHGTAPLLDQPIPPPVPGYDPTIIVHLVDRPLPAFPATPGEPEPGTVTPIETMTVAQVFETIEADWRAALEIEIQLKITRKRLGDLFVRIKALNRDLNGDERVHSSNQDKKDWQDARRALRDAENRLTMMMKQFDIGDTSTAGQRSQFEQTYETYVVSRVPFDGLRQAQRDYAVHRKQVSTLQNAMNAAYSQSGLDGERRAQQVLKRIADKIRQASTKKNFLGVIVD